MLSDSMHPSDRLELNGGVYQRFTQEDMCSIDQRQTGRLCLSV